MSSRDGRVATQHTPTDVMAYKIDIAYRMRRPGAPVVPGAACKYAPVEEPSFMPGGLEPV